MRSDLRTHANVGHRRRRGYDLRKRMNERAGKRRRARSGAGVVGILGSIAFAVMPVPAHASPPSPPHIMLIVEENAAYGSAQGTPYIINNPSAPYINNNLVGTYTSATNWYAVQHNSPHDYLDLLDGSDLGVPSGKPYSSHDSGR